MPQQANTHRDLCMIMAKYMLKQAWCDIACWEIAYNDGFVDAIGLSSPLAKEERIVAIEVKRTRADLLADINRKKFLKYEQGSTHCYLAATASALGLNKKKDKQVVLKDLEERGLPKYWGIIVLPSHGWSEPFMLRPAKRYGKTIPGRQLELTIKIAASFAHRILSKASPLEE